MESSDSDLSLETNNLFDFFMVMFMRRRVGEVMFVSILQEILLFALSTKRPSLHKLKKNERIKPAIS